MVIHPGGGLRWYKRWIMPKPSREMAVSQTDHPYQPEIIEICEEAIKSWCDFKDYPECSIKFRIDVASNDATSFYRMKVFNGTNKMEHDKPVASYLDQAYDVEYYWFVSKAAMQSGLPWHYDIGLGIRRGDADLYVSVMDGRYPTENDFDYHSDMIGTDFIRISSTDSIFAGSPSPHHWDANSGVMIVIAVIA
jgi:hypothetical protein